MRKNKQTNSFGRHSLNALRRSVGGVEVAATEREAQQFVGLVADRSDMFQGVLDRHGIEEKKSFVEHLLRSQCYVQCERFS